MKFPRFLFVSITAITVITTTACAEWFNNQTSTPTPSIATSSTPTSIPKTAILSGASSYTPYDAFAMLLTRDKPAYPIIWTNSGGESGQLLVSKADSTKRPDWILATQGVVAGLVARGEKVVIIGSVYVSDRALLPVYRKPKKPLAGSRSLFIPRSSIEFAFDNLLAREKVQRSDVLVPKVEKINFQTIVTLLNKPQTENDALDVAILVEPFITNVVSKAPDQYEIGEGGLYTMHYSIVAREEDVKANPEKYKELLQKLILIDKKLTAMDLDTFYKEVWGRQKDGKPELLPRLLTYDPKPAGLKLQMSALRKNLRSEIEYLVKKYPDQLKAPTDIDAIVDASLLQAVAPERVEK